MPNELEFSPGIDLVTDWVAVVMQDQPVVGMSSWLSDAYTSAVANDRGLQLVTLPTTRLTWPVRSKLFVNPLSRWIVATGDGEYFDGLNGLRMKWNGDLFVAGEGAAAEDIHPDFFVAEQPTAHLQLTVGARHQATESLGLGPLAETLFAATTGAPPTGWSTSEPVTQPWSREALTEYCRGRAPRRTWLVLSGRALGTLEVRRTPSGVHETITLAVPQPGLELPSPQWVGQVIDDVADNFELTSALAMGAFGAADGTYQPRFSGLLGPIGLGAGYEVLQGRALPDALAVDGVPDAVAIGPARKPAVWYPLGDGRNPDDWSKYRKLVEKLSQAA